MWNLSRWCATAYVLLVGSYEGWTPNPYALGMTAVIVCFSITTIELMVRDITSLLRKRFG